MAQAYVLINCEMGAEESVIEELKHVDYVKEVHGTFGAYDVVAKLAAEKTESLRQAIKCSLAVFYPYGCGIYM